MFVGCFGLLFILGIAAAEVYSFVVASHLLRAHAADLIGGSGGVDTILPIILIQIVLMVVGIVVVKNAVARLPLVMIGALTGQGGEVGKLVVRILGGLLLIVPGFFLDVIGILLLLPPVQMLLSSIGTRVAMSLLRRQMTKMFPGGMPMGGMAGMGGFGGIPPGMFPGMQPRGGPLTPDERIPRRPGKVIDTTAERVDGKN